MRFHKSDLPGLLIATLAPAGLMLLFLASFEVWEHHGTPLLGAMAGNIAVGGGLIAGFSRFIRRWGVPILGFVLILSAVAVVNVLKLSGDDGTAISTLFKWLGVVGFGIFNVSVALQILTNGLIPALNQRAARAARS